MADNTTRGVTSGGDTIRDVDRGAAKTTVVIIDAGGQAGPEALLTLGQHFNVASLPVALSIEQQLAFGQIQSLIAHQTSNAAFALYIHQQQLASAGGGFIPLEFPFTLGGF